MPLLPRRLLPEPTEEKTPKKKGGAATLTPPPPVEDLTGLELDNQLVVHAYNSAIGFVFTSVGILWSLLFHSYFVCAFAKPVMQYLVIYN